MADLDYMRSSDENLLAQAKAGDRSAFEAFYRRHKRRVLNYIYRLIHNRASAEEIAQEVFVKCYVNMQRYKERGKPLSWVYTIAKNLCRNFLRDRQHEPKLLLNKELPGEEGLSMQDVIPAEGADPSRAAMRKEQEDLVQRRLELLPMKYREVLILCDIQGFAYEEAARILKCRVGSVGSRLSRARLLLAKSLRKYYGKAKEDSQDA